jgi:hypothetical protein
MRMLSACKTITFCALMLALCVSAHAEEALPIAQREMEMRPESPGKVPPRVPGPITPTEREPRTHPGPATTRKDACDKYANDAVLQYKALMKLPGQCNLSGPGWSPDYSYHFNWCMAGDNLSGTSEESKQRQAALAKCKHYNCDSYANDAVWRYNETKKLGCNYTGPQWSPDHNYHYNWCMKGNNISFIEAERNARKIKHIECICKDYSKTAISQSQENKQKGCGFTGPEWSSDYNIHFKWCMKVNDSTREKEQDAREANLSKCNKCANYAKTAVSQNDKNKQKGCNLSGPQWSSDYNSHFNWCMKGQNHKIAWKETNARTAALNTCSSTPPPPPTPPQPTTKTTTISGFKQVPYTGKIYYIAKIQIPNGKLTSVKNPNLGLGKQWTVMILKPGVSSQDCGKAGKTINIPPGSSTTALKDASLYNLILGFCLNTTDAFTYKQGLPPSWGLRITYNK